MNVFLRFRWLLGLWMLLAAVVFVPPATFAYDALSQLTVVYDAVSVLATGEKKTGVMGDHILFAKFARFLVARGISKLDDAANAVEDFFLGGLGKIIKMQMGIRF